MSLIGYPDLDRPVTASSGQLFYGFGGGPLHLAPFRCGVLTTASGEASFRLDLTRALSDRDSNAMLACMIGAEYATDEALARVRAIDPAASLASCVLTDWWFRMTPTPTLSGHADLLAPLQLSSNGLGTARMMMPLSIEGGLILEAMLREHGPFEAVAEAQLAGVAPRVPVVVRFNSSALLGELLKLADSAGALPRRLVADFFRRQPASLPLGISGTIGAENAQRFADAMTDRIVARFGRHIPAREIADAPVVQLAPAQANSAITWSLSQPFLAQRRIVLPVDLLSAAQAQIDRLGPDSVIHRRNLAALPPLGQVRVRVLCNLPAARAGVDALGVTLTFPPYPPYRPQAVTATALFDTADDIAEVNVRLSPGEPLRYRYAPFAVLSDQLGTHQFDASAVDGDEPLLHLSPEHFPVEFALVEATPALARLAVIAGTCSYDHDGQRHQQPFTLDSGRPSTAIAVPRGHASLRIDATAIDRTGTGELHAGPFESTRVRLDVTAFPSYGPQQAGIRCVFDDSAALRAVSLLPMGSADLPENITTMSFSPAEPVRTWLWFAPSPFASGFRYRAFGLDGTAWLEAPANRELVLYSSQLRPQKPEREVTARAGKGMRESIARRPGRTTETTAPEPEAAIVAVASSPTPDPTDEVMYARIDDPGKKLFVPRYVLDVQTVSGKQRYRISMAQHEASSTLEVNLVATPASALGDQARDASEYPHLLTIQLDFLVSPPAGVRKMLEFTDVTRNGNIVTATITFATLVERDDVFRALTERERQARLVVRRFIDVSIPLQASPRPRGEGPDPRPLPPVLPRRPPLNIPRKTATVPRPRPGPIAADTAQPILAGSSVFTSVAASMLLVRTERAAAQGREGGIINARLLASPILHNAVLAKPIRIPVDRFVDTLPTPQLAFTGSEDAGDWRRCKLSIVNWAEFSDEFFAPSDDLPPCGLNKAASRTWVDIHDAASGKRLYGFCALGSGRQLAELWVALPADASTVTSLQVTLTDRRTGVARTSNAVSATPSPPSEPPRQSVRLALEQAVEPETFVFPPALHGYIYQGVTPGSASNQLVRHRFSWHGTFHTYLQDASRPAVVYVFADEFKIARRPDPPFTPYATVRVSSRPDGSASDVVFDYVVAPTFNQKRLENARAQLLADPRFGAARVEFQPLLTSDVRFFIDRPTQAGSVREQRPDVALVLQGSVKDTLAMPLGDFRLLFDAMHKRTAALFGGYVEIDVPDAGTEVIPFVARMDELAGEMFAYDAAAAADGSVKVILTNEIESAVDIQTMDATITRDGTRTRALVQGTALPREQLQPGESIALVLAPETAIAASSPPEVAFDLGGVTVAVDAEAVWNSILDRTTLEHFKLVTVKAVPTLFAAVAGKDEEQIISILVEFEGGGTGELTAATPQVQVRVDYPVDDVILGRPVAATYRYTATVIRASGRQDTDPKPREGSADLFFISIVR